jgi:hypothetical protein
MSKIQVSMQTIFESVIFLSPKPGQGNLMIGVDDITWRLMVACIQKISTGNGAVNVLSP